MCESRTFKNQNEEVWCPAKPIWEKLNLYTQNSFLTVSFLTVRPHSLAHSLAALTKCHLRTHQMSRPGCEPDRQVTILLAEGLGYLHMLVSFCQYLAAIKLRTHQEVSHSPTPHSTLRTHQNRDSQKRVLGVYIYIYIYIYMYVRLCFRCFV